MDSISIVIGNTIWWGLILGIVWGVKNIKSELMARSVMSDTIWHCLLIGIIPGLLVINGPFSRLKIRLYEEHKISLENWAFLALVILFIGSQVAVHLLRSRRISKGAE